MEYLKTVTQSETVKDKAKLKIYLLEAFERIFAGCCLLVCCPIFVIIGVLVWWEDKGDVFFLQERIGKDQKPFLLYKFRSMKSDAEQQKQFFTIEQKREYIENYKLADDQRVTKIGKILRCTGLDELPQLYNILRGEMSFIGPRPVVQDELEKYGQYRKEFCSIKPGITGYWQVNRQTAKNYRDRMEMELYYIRHRTSKMNLQILFATAVFLLKRKKKSM